GRRRCRRRADLITHVSQITFPHPARRRHQGGGGSPTQGGPSKPRGSIPAPKTRRSPARQPERAIKGGNMLLGTLHPAIRLVVGVAVVVIGVAVHKVYLDVIGGAVVALSAFQWMTRQKG